MRTVRFLLEKEFRQIFRNKPLTIMIIMVPVIQLLILPLAADYEIKDIRINIIDHDHSGFSRTLISKVQASEYFTLTGYNNAFSLAYTQIEKDQADVILEIPPHFERDLIKEDKQELFVAVNAINGIKASLGGNYLINIIADFNKDIKLQWQPAEKFGAVPAIIIQLSHWYNPFMNYHLFMVPAILAILVTMIGGYLSALNIVKEKEVGTIEQINVTPIKKHHFILGKLIPFWILGIVDFSLGMLIAWLVYGIVPEGSIFLLYGFLAIYLLAVLGFGLLISTYTNTQQQAMFVAFFFVMIFILMSGLFTSIDSMPFWAKIIAQFNPVTYFIEVMRMVVLKGSGFSDIYIHLLIVLLFAIIFNGWAVWNYKKVG